MNKNLVIKLSKYRKIIFMCRYEKTRVIIEPPLLVRFKRGQKHGGRGGEVDLELMHKPKIGIRMHYFTVISLKSLESVVCLNVFCCCCSLLQNISKPTNYRLTLVQKICWGVITIDVQIPVITVFLHLLSF